MSEYFSKQKSFGGRVKVEWDWSNYAAKVDLKNATDVDTSKLAQKFDLANLKSDVDKLDIDKLKSVPTCLNSLKGNVDKLDVGNLETTQLDLNKLSNVVKSDVIKKIEYNALVKNVNS